MGWQPGQDDEAGEVPGRGPDMPPGRDPRLAEFASRDGTDALLPTGELALLVDKVSGPERRSPGATSDELIGLVRAWTALESWAVAAKLGVIRELIRRDGVPVPGSDHGDLPETWSTSVRYELSNALACSTQSAETTAWLAWELQARLPGIGALLDDGTLTLAKARAVAETFKYLTDSDAVAAAALIVGLLAGKTYTQVMRLAEQAALTVDPDLAARRREQAQKRNARVACFREPAGTAALSGRDLPPDEALAAMASVNDRAGQYRESDAFGDTPMDVLRAHAYLDLLNGVPAADRIARAEPQDEEADSAESLAWAMARADRARADRARADRARADRARADRARADRSADESAGRTAAATQSGPRPVTDPTTQSAPGTGSPGITDDAQCHNARPASDDCACAECDGSCLRDDGFDTEEPDDGDPNGGDPGPGDPGPGGSPEPGVSSAGAALQRRPADLIVPLLTLLGLAERPGEIQGFGLLDAALARKLAAAAAASPRTEVCVTVTSPDGYAIGHGCARTDRIPRRSQEAAFPVGPGFPTSGCPTSSFPTSSFPGPVLAGFPARLNLTIPAAALPDLAGNGRAGQWMFTPSDSPGPPRTAAPPGTSAPLGSGAQPDGYGIWLLVLPNGGRFAVRLDLVPTFECDHRYESAGYQPSDKLRHLVQIRDGTCTFPSCNRHARESDFEHGLPFDQGGRTCCCNAGARSRACHRVKQSPGWHVTQPKPGWHRWQTPAGRVYIQDPKRYPA